MTCFSLLLILAHKSFFREKSLRVSLFANISLIHNELQNDTSKYIYKEVS